MSPTTQVLLSGALTFGVPMLLAFRELRALRRPRRGSGWGGEPALPPPPPPSPTEQGPPARPLPECLIIAARGLPQRQTREPELV
jgi:hypothetical protein